MNDLNQSKVIHSWCEKWVWANQNLIVSAGMTQTHVVLTILEPKYQSQPSPTIDYTYYETLEGLRCCGNLQTVNSRGLVLKSSQPILYS